MRWKWIVGIGVTLAMAIMVTAYALLSSYDFNRLKPRIISAVKSATGRELSLQGDIRLEIGLRPLLVVEDVQLGNAEWGSRPALAAIRRFEVQVALIPMIWGDIEVKKLFLTRPDILIETDESGRSNLDFEKRGKVGPESDGDLPVKGGAVFSSLTIEEVRIEQGHLAYRDRRSGRTFTVELHNLTAVCTGRQGPFELSFKGVYNSRPFQVAGTLGRLDAFVNAGEAWPLALKVVSGRAQLQADGTIRDCLNFRGMDFYIKAEGPTLSDFALPAGFTGLPDLGPLKFSAGVVDSGDGVYKLSGLEIILGKTDVSGSAELVISGKRPRLLANLTSRGLDFRSIFFKQDGKKERTRDPARGRVFPSDPLPLDALRLVDADIKVRAGRVLLPSLAMKDLKIGMTLEDGHLIVSPLRSAIGGGSVDGKLDLHSAGRKASLKLALKVERLDLGAMLKDMGLKEVVEGSFQADIALMCCGHSVAAMMASLNGNAVIVMGKGRIPNRYIDLLGGDISSGIFRLLNPVKLAADYTEFNCFVSQFDISDGLAETTALVLDTPSMSVVGDGSVDLKTETLDLSLQPAPKKGLGISGLGRLSLSLGELAKPFRLGGTLAEPSLALDPTRTAITIGKMVGGGGPVRPAGDRCGHGIRRIWGRKSMPEGH